MRSNFIAAWVTQQQRAFNQSSRGIMTPENRQVLENEAEAGMAAIERAAAEKAWAECDATITAHLVGRTAITASIANDWPRNPYRAAALGLTAEQEGKNNERRAEDVQR